MSHIRLDWSEAGLHVDGLYVEPSSQQGDLRAADYFPGGLEPPKREFQRTRQKLHHLYYLNVGIYQSASTSMFCYMSLLSIPPAVST